MANRLRMLSAGSTSSIGIGVGGELQLEQPAQRRALARLLVHRLRVFLVDLVLAGSRRVLQLEHRVGVEEMELSVAPPLVLAALVEVAIGDRALRERQRVARAHLFGDGVDADAADARRGVREIPLDELLLEADGFENLRAAIALQRRDAHLGHHLQDALVQRLDVALDGLLVRQAGQHSAADHVVERLEREVRVHGAGAVADEQRQMVHFARFARSR